MVNLLLIYNHSISCENAHFWSLKFDIKGSKSSLIKVWLLNGWGWDLTGRRNFTECVVIRELFCLLLRYHLFGEFSTTLTVINKSYDYVTGIIDCFCCFLFRLIDATNVSIISGRSFSHTNVVIFHNLSFNKFLCDLRTSLNYVVGDLLFL
jgi:hypothetical protein